MKSVVWLTGLSGSGKSSIAKVVAENLRSSGHSVILLDGDELREVFGSTAANSENHGRAGRYRLAMQYAHLCRILTAQGFTVVIATISLFREVHAWNRANIPGYFEIYLKTPLEELRRRDPKGIYRRFDAGELDNVAGLDLPVDEPESPDLVIDYSPESSLEDSVAKVMNALELRKPTSYAQLKED